MGSRARRAAPAPLARGLLRAAATSYAANCALGASVAAGLLDTRGYRWLHHVLYGATTGLTGAAGLALLARRDRAAWTLLPALGPLALLPRTRARTPRHARVGLAPAPCYLLSLWRVGR